MSADFAFVLAGDRAGFFWVGAQLKVATGVRDSGGAGRAFAGRDKNDLRAVDGLAVKGDNAGEGIPTLNQYFAGYTFQRNALIGAAASAYPADNFFPANVNDVGFVDYAGGNYRLAATSPS